ncbi:MAG: hypothetical protein HYW97_00960 [Candidatus Wildermuthbacteria bacterium]|nr:hypothetical protein [Candidatus Wildermuthbacteria bacterium]
MVWSAGETSTPGTPGQLNEIRKSWGWDGIQSARKWSKEMLAKCGCQEGLFHLPQQLKPNSEQPRNIEFWKEIERRFPSVFTWEIRKGKGVITSRPTVDGDCPTLFDLLVMPRDLVDQWAPETGGGFFKTMLFGKPWHQPWVVQTLTRNASVGKKATAECLDLLSQWEDAFPQEKTFVQEKFGVPSLLVRFDCVWRKDTGLGVYEIEERPAGVGITLTLNQQFRTLLSSLQKEWPEFSVVVSPRRAHHGGDDHLWVPEVPLGKALEGDGLVFVRADPDEIQFHALAPRSVSTIATKGLKSYGLALGLWKTLDAQEVAKNPELLPWEEGFCIKPFKGSKTRGIAIWKPGEKSDVARQQLLARIQSPEGAYMQPFIPPLRMRIRGKPYNYIFRIFFGYSPKRQEWLPLGGNWDARPAPIVLIHGAFDAVAGSATLTR